ncbi:hypothetical protein BpHYR1_052458 [Brachionus plicatilis]|uniref:Uncharacterized protein n=1 Tax=Brachionus plicatilis TaxID=10195 RepID=A0A3M7QZD9_BRAPC|nr:hypothetical protein BpHYR1_052458 [Brachionus plicatilis]
MSKTCSNKNTDVSVNYFLTFHSKTNHCKLIQRKKNHSKVEFLIARLIFSSQVSYLQNLNLNSQFIDTIIFYFKTYIQKFAPFHTVSRYPLIFSSGLGTGNGMIATQQSAAKVTYGTFIINSATHPST